LFTEDTATIRLSLAVQKEGCKMAKSGKSGKGSRNASGMTRKEQASHNVKIEPQPKVVKKSKGKGKGKGKKTVK
jgi:hypothetical protein